MTLRELILDMRGVVVGCTGRQRLGQRGTRGGGGGGGEEPWYLLLAKMQLQLQSPLLRCSKSFLKGERRRKRCFASVSAAQSEKGADLPPRRPLHPCREGASSGASSTSSSPSGLGMLRLAGTKLRFLKSIRRKACVPAFSDFQFLSVAVRLHCDQPLCPKATATMAIVGGLMRRVTGNFAQKVRRLPGHSSRPLSPT